LVTSYDLWPGNGAGLFWKEKISKKVDNKKIRTEKETNRKAKQTQIAITITIILLKTQQTCVNKSIATQKWKDTKYQIKKK